MFSNDVYSSLNIESGILILNYCKRPGEASTIASFDGKNGQIQNQPWWRWVLSVLHGFVNDNGNYDE